MNNTKQAVKFRHLIAVIFMLGMNQVFPVSMYAQEINITVNKNYDNLPFDQFIEKIESEFSVNFYYQEEWTKNIHIRVTDSSSDLSKILSDALEPLGLQFYVDNQAIILYKGPEIANALPQYKKQDNSETAELVYAEKTESEKKYIASKKTEGFQLIEVGQKSNSISETVYIIRGKLTDYATGEPLIGATVFVEELGRGAATDLDGQFQLALKPGKYFVRAKSLSMKEHKFYLQVYSDGQISVPLEKELVSVNEVVVYADKIDNVGGMQMGFDRISSKELKEIPVVMGEKDLLKVAQMLPGVQSAGEGASGINVRGGTADQNLFYINKMPVYNTSHLFGFFTAFNPDIVNNFSLYKSNIPANYGGRVSSIFDISTRQGNKKKFFAQGGISPITARVAIEGPIIKNKASYVLSYRATYSDWILSKMDDINLRNSQAAFYDLSGSVNGEINEKNLMKVFFYNSYDRFSLSTSDDYDYSNTGTSVIWKHFLSSSLNVDVAAVFSSYDFSHNNKANPSDAYNHQYRLTHTEFKSDFSYLSNNNHKILFGASSIFYSLNRGDIVPYGAESVRIPIHLNPEKGVENALYISDEFSAGTRLTLSTGLRYSFYGIFGPMEINEYLPNSPVDEDNIKEVKTFGNELVKAYSGLEPRVAANFSLRANNSLKASYNRSKQYIFMLSNTVAISPTDQWKLADYHLKPPTSDQVSLGYYHDFPQKGISTSMEVYQKWTRNIVEYKDGIDFISPKPTEMLLLQGQQDAYGLELMIKKSTGKLTGWISYTHSNSTILVDNALPTERINYGNRYPSNFDRPHSLNFVSTARINRRLSFSGNVVYGSGRPITYPIASYYVNGQEVLHYSERNKYRIPDYFRIDMSINIEGNLNKKKAIHSFWMLNVYNLTGRKNAYSVYFESTNGQMQGYKLSVFGQPIVTLSWNFKFGNYVSE